ncbi:MAG: thioredoxin reductase, partial [Sphingomonadales bacterium]|nr:thioredoxin reductase [Sphingomonadales bacterium]
MFLRLSDNEIGRIAQFGEQRRFQSGQTVARAGEVGDGLMVILSGSVEVTRVEGGK